MERAAGREVQFPAVGDFGRLGAWPILAGACPEWSSASVGEKKRLCSESRPEGPFDREIVR